MKSRKLCPLAARIKKLMQLDDDVGKISQATPILIGKAMELFLQKVCDQACLVAQSRQAKTVSTSHLKAYVNSEETMDFLKDIVSSAPDLAEGEIDREAPRQKKRRTDELGDPHTATPHGGPGAHGGGRGRGRGTRIILPPPGSLPPSGSPAPLPPQPRVQVDAQYQQQQQPLPPYPPHAAALLAPAAAAPSGTGLPPRPPPVEPKTESAASSRPVGPVPPAAAAAAGPGSGAAAAPAAADTISKAPPAPRASFLRSTHPLSLRPAHPLGIKRKSDGCPADGATAAATSTAPAPAPTHASTKHSSDSSTTGTAAPQQQNPLTAAPHALAPSGSVSAAVAAVVGTPAELQLLAGASGCASSDPGPSGHVVEQMDEDPNLHAQAAAAVAAVPPSLPPPSMTEPAPAQHSLDPAAGDALPQQQAGSSGEPADQAEQTNEQDQQAAPLPYLPADGNKDEKAVPPPIELPAMIPGLLAGAAFAPYSAPGNNFDDDDYDS